MNYGAPYMGSKSKIAPWVIKIFPKAENFYDLFGGGFSITHALLLHRSKDFNRFHFNEPRKGIIDLIKRAIAGEFSYDRFKPPFIDRKTFHEKKDKDAYIKMVWSFGNKGMAYLFNEEIEPYKRSLHNAIVFNELDELAQKVLGMRAFNPQYSINQRRLFLRYRIDQFRITKIPEFLYPYLSKQHLEILASNKKPENLKQLKQLQQLQQLQQLERLQFSSLQSGRLVFSQCSYDEIEIKPNSLIYCDPPYAKAGKYDSEFNSLKFFNWAASQKAPVLISEYNIKHEGLFQVAQVPKRSEISPKKEKNPMKVLEKIYANQAALDVMGARDFNKKAELVS